MNEASMKHDQTRGHTIEDQFGFLFVTTEPVISSSGVTRRAHLRAQSRRRLLSDALALLRVENMVAGMRVNNGDCHESSDDQCGEYTHPAHV